MILNRGIMSVLLTAPVCQPFLFIFDASLSAFVPHPFGAAWRRLPVEHPGTEGAGQAGGAWVVSQKSQKKITDCRRNVFLSCGSLFLDSRGAGLYNYPMVSNN